MALRQNKTVRETPTGQNLPHSMCPKPPAQCLAHSSSINTFKNNKKTNGQFYSLRQADKATKFVPLKCSMILPT